MKGCPASYCYAAVLIAVLAVPTLGALAVDNFQRLRGPQIQAKFAGMEMTDEVHWADVYGRNGTLTTYEMGDKRVGKWWVQNDELCQNRGKGQKACYAVWISGKKVELGLVPFGSIGLSLFAVDLWLASRNLHPAALTGIDGFLAVHAHWRVSADLVGGVRRG